MGLLDDALGAVGGTGGGSGNKVVGAVSGLLERAGGLEGVMSKLESSGLGDKVQSWIGTGANKEISRGEVRQALGDEEVKTVARDAGVSEDEAADGLAGMLPEIVDRTSPGGKLPDVGQLGSAVGGLLKR
jgi:uncharacterized protein YidB (DUF937 family)